MTKRQAINNLREATVDTEEAKLHVERLLEKLKEVQDLEESEESAKDLPATRR